MFAVSFLIVFSFQGVRGYSPLTAALYLIPLSLMSVVTGPLSGMLADRIGAQIPATAGLLFQAAAVAWFELHLSLSTPYGRSVARVADAMPGRGGRGRPERREWRCQQ
jgi:MFS family permease